MYSHMLMDTSSIGSMKEIEKGMVLQFPMWKNWYI